MIDRRSLLRAIGAGAGVTIAGGSIVGCSNPVGEDRDPNTVRLWGIGAADSDKEAKVIEAFTEQHPDVKIEVSQVPSNGEGDASGAITAVRGRTGPDIYWMDRFNSPQFASLGLLEPIDGLIEEYEGVSAEEFMSGWIKFAADELYYDGQYYGLPVSTDTRAVYVNMDLVNDAGLDPVLFDPKNGPLSYEQVWEINDSFNVQDKNGTYERVTWIPWDDQAKLIVWAMAADVPFFSNETCRMLLDSPEMLAVAEMYAGWIERLDFPRLDAFKATYQPENAPPTQTSFFSGRQLLQITNPSGVQALADYKPDMNYAVTYLPVPDEGTDPYSWSGGFALSMPKGSSMSRAAWEFLKFYAGPEGQKILTPQLASIPTHLETIADPAGWNPDIAFFVELLDVTRSRPPLPVGTKLWDAMETMQGSLTQASDTPEHLVKEAQQYVDPTMQQFCPFRLPDGFGEPDPNLRMPKR
ncbi:extracellular solute-binding protein [Brachybacterium sacelli]|uniref:ABC-type glycerol-3-phosphate transport system substrate-binding protein n=1 Tax=Brachybacterium sacelli TaxID=173364 RepID=A0ABS4X1P9_9MICO|nr:ABC-type glycerol-3-phosphate transport system substrate-binding protein [Brachybacterium sacelli]